VYILNWIEVTILTTSEAVDAISDFIQELGANVSISDPNDLKNFKTDLNWVIIDEALKSSEDVIIKAYFPENRDIEGKILYIEEKLKVISKYLDIGKGQVKTNLINEEDWANGWKKYYKTIKVTDKIVIRPTWEQYICS
jgi:ribosomal protein L11 methyltransferase